MAERGIVLRYKLKRIENLVGVSIRMIVRQPDVMKLRNLSRFQLRLKIVLPFTHAIQIRNLQIPRAVTERIFRKIIAESATQLIVLLDHPRECLVTGQEVRQRQREVVLTEQLVSILC